MDLAGLKTGPDYLSPINDTIYCPTAVGGETITDALTESYKIINTARNLEGLEVKMELDIILIFQSRLSHGKLII